MSTQLELALFEPEIPQNTGNIGRLCVGWDVHLSLIGPLGFSLDDRERRRAGLDYWKHLSYKYYNNFEDFWLEKKSRKVICLSKFGKKTIFDYQFSNDDLLLLGKETTGVPEELTEKLEIERISIPMNGNIRSFNLANSAAMVLSEAKRQLDFS